MSVISPICIKQYGHKIFVSFYLFLLDNIKFPDDNQVKLATIN